MSHGFSQSSYSKFYIGLFLVLLLSPWILSVFEKDVDPYAYFSMSKPIQARYFAKILKEGPKNIDLVILGSSGSEHAFDANLLTDYWKSRSQAEPVIYNLSAFFGNSVYNFGVADALLSQKHVKTFVVELTDWETKNKYAFQFFRWRSPGLEEALQRAPYADRLRFYSESVMGFPWRLWVLLHPYNRVEPTPENRFWFDKIEQDKGAWYDTTLDQSLDPNVIRLTPSKTDPHDYLYYDRTAKMSPAVPRYSLLPLQVLFLQYLKKRCDELGCRLILVTTTLPQNKSDALPYPANIPAELGDTPFISVNEKKLFGRYEQDVWQFAKQDPAHRNKTGRTLFTNTLAPLLYELAGEGPIEKR